MATAERVQSVKDVRTRGMEECEGWNSARVGIVRG